MIRKASSEGIGYSVADLNHARYLFAAAIPHNGDDLQTQAKDALATIEAVTHDEGCPGSIVHQAVFISDHSQVEACRKIIEDFYGEELPATAFVIQPPCEGKRLAIEAWGICRGAGDFHIQRISPNLVLVRHGGLTWGHCAGIVPQTDAPAVYDRSLDAFQRMSATLASQGFAYDQVVRTWLYLGDIVGPEGDTQRYKELNRARADFYQDIPFLQEQILPAYQGEVYPASTGIGTSNRDVMMGCIALATDRPDLQILPLENPLQTSAFDYEAAHGPASPKFSRAMAIIGRRTAGILVSGTASITRSDTQFVGDVESQTRQTLDNIEALIAAENFQRYGLDGVGATLDDMVIARVYIKRQEDYAAARAICEQRLGELPTIYAVADVCRPDLLVEIEGAAFCPVR
jgi:enamine deaminase RidA (YjgF/YER057c/UK114 family)